MPGWAIGLLLISIVAILLIILLFSCFKDICNTHKYIRFMQNFFKIIVVMQKKNLPIEIAIEQVKLDFYELNWQSKETNQTVEILDALNRLIFIFDTNPKNKIIKSADIDHEVIRDFAVEIYNYLKQQDPFAEISNKEANLLNNIKLLINDDQIELGVKTLEQLSDEIKLKDKIIEKKERQNKKTTIISIVGTILTVVFGIISIVLYFVPH